jgi:O-acetyl-ADP-ribose deacetylase (regulator of RNase III)
MKVDIIEGDLLEQKVEVIVNAWNRNIIPWWLLLPQGVSGAIKRKAGIAPFRELAEHGPMKLGEAVLTGAGKLDYRGIIHVAGINMLWRASRYSIQTSVANAMNIVFDKGFKSVAFPIIGAGSGSFDTKTALELIVQKMSTIEGDAEVFIIRYRK